MQPYALFSWYVEHSRLMLAYQCIIFTVLGAYAWWKQGREHFLTETIMFACAIVTFFIGAEIDRQEPLGTISSNRVLYRDWAAILSLSVWIHLLGIARSVWVQIRSWEYGVDKNSLQAVTRAVKEYPERPKKRARSGKEAVSAALAKVTSAAKKLVRLLVVLLLVGGCSRATPQKDLSYLPYVTANGQPTKFRCAYNLEAEVMGKIFATSDWQRRPSPRCHPLLALAAQRKADSMLQERYFSHTFPDGTSANANVRRTGYTLPDWYQINDNNVESIGLNYPTPQAMFDAWLTGDLHRRHIAGEHSFFQEQNCFGMGYTKGPANSGIYYVVITAPCN